MKFGNAVVDGERSVAGHGAQRALIEGGSDIVARINIDSYGGERSCKIQITVCYTECPGPTCRTVAAIKVEYAATTIPSLVELLWAVIMELIVRVEPGEMLKLQLLTPLFGRSETDNELLVPTPALVP